MRSGLIVFCMTMLLALPNIYAQPKADAKEFGWATSGRIGANFTQVGLKNWAGGGVNTVGITGLFSYSANYSSEVSLWENSLEIGYGLTKLGDQNFRKSDDRFAIISKYGYKATDVLSYAAVLDFRTQLTEGLNYDKDGNPTARISNLLAPAFLVVGVGATYTPVDYFSVTIAPLGNRLVIVADDSLNRYKAFGVDSGKVIKSFLGASMNVRFKKDLMTNVNLESRLDVFAPYTEFTKQIVTWNTILSLKVNDYFNASFALDMFYDERIPIKRDDETVGPATQIRNVIGIGFGYKF